VQAGPALDLLADLLDARARSGVAGATGVALALVGRAVSGPERGVDADVESPLPRLGVTGADAVLLVSPMSSTTSLNVRCRMAVRSSRRCGALMPDAC